jgi:hypothetical protein
MTSARRWVSASVWAVVLGAMVTAQGPPQEFVRVTGAACAAPPVLHCPDGGDCPSAQIINQGPVVEMKTRRTYFLDYPCDLKKGEPVTFILSLHGGGSYGNWQRHYFPIMDFVNQHRLVIATPNSPTRAWSEADDVYLQNIATFVIEQFGRANIKAFWLAGHSQGGMTSNRLVRTEFFKTKVDGWLSLSGGRLGGAPGRASFGAIGPATPTGAPAAGAAGGAAAGGAMTAAMAAMRELPAADFSFIFETGEREMDAKGMPDASEWAKKYSCGPKGAARKITDTKAGYVFDRTRLNTMNMAWGLLPAPGDAEIRQYDGCKDGRVVADVTRLKKGHTEGLEPKITEELVKLMLSAKGGKIQGGG